MNNEYYVDNGLSMKQETVIKKCKVKYTILATSKTKLWCCRIKALKPYDCNNTG